VSRLVSVGDVIADVVLAVDALPPRGGDVLAGSGRLAAGAALNVLAAAARAGLPGLYAGAHGTGPLGDLVRAALAAEGIAVLHPREARADTGFTVALVDAGAERTFVTVLGAEAWLGPAHLAATPVAAGDWVHVSGYGLAYPGTGAALAAWLPGLPAGARVIADPGPLAAEAPPEVLAAVRARADWISANEAEALALTGAPDPEAAAARLAARWARSGAVVRLGAAGCLVAAGGAPVRVPAPSVRAVDASGAGDTHVGTFAAALAHGAVPLAAARRANAAAALSVTRAGPVTAPSSGEVDAALARMPPGGGG
jgi:sugar/nucleoside kinase (ribokinase family)